uniref:Protein unc-45 homolog B-like n=1 Tax=Saccoglossus kowalevskii TaxID=10224 RepID=A0ABM0LYH0_SACKO
MEQSLQYKQEGNQCFSQGKYKEAIIAYTNAIDSCPEDNKNDRAVFFKNRAACHLKLENYKVAVKDADQALELSPSDAKALYRKCQALENLGSHEEAYKESRKLIHLDPKNTAVQTMCRRLAALLTTKAEDQSKTVNRVSQMFNLLNTKDECDIEKKRQAAQNLIVLAREEAGAERIFRENGVPQILNLANDDDKETKLSALRALACICTGHKARSCAIVRDVGLDKLGKYIGTDDEDLASAGANILQQIIFSFIKEDTTEHKGKEQAVVADTDKEIKSILLFVMKLLTDKSISGYGRDAVLDILIKTLPNKHGKGKSLSFITNGGLNKLLHVACQVPDLKRLPITPNTRMRTSLLFEELYDSMLSDKNRAYYKELVNKFLTERFMHNVMESNMEAITAITALLQGPFDVGSEMIQRDGVMEIMVAMAASKDEKLQIVSTEAIIHTASKKKHCLGVLSAGVPILKELYKSKNVTERVRVRALVGLCKFGCYGGTDASIRAFAEGSNIRLASEIRRFLLNAQKDADIRKWAAEGLGYLTLDADVKEALCEDEEALKAVIQTAKTMDTSMYYGYASIFVNLTNSYYKDEPPKELVDLARFAKQHVPEEHLKDAPEYVVKRVKLLLKLGVVTSLVFMSNKTDSNAVKELLS